MPFDRVTFTAAVRASLADSDNLGGINRSQASQDLADLVAGVCSSIWYRGAGDVATSLLEQVAFTAAFDALTVPRRQRVVGVYTQANVQLPTMTPVEAIESSPWVQSLVAETHAENKARRIDRLLQTAPNARLPGVRDESRSRRDDRRVTTETLQGSQSSPPLTILTNQRPPRRPPRRPPSRPSRRPRGN